MKTTTPRTDDGRAAAAPLRTAFYARFSSDAQKDTSINDQLAACRRHAERQGWPAPFPAHVYTDAAVSGSSAHGRTAYQKLLADIAGSNGRPPFDIILVDDWSRISRDMEESARLMKMAPIWGLRIVGASDGTDTGAKGARLLTGVRAVVADAYIDDLRQKVKRGLRGTLVDRHCAPGCVPYGFTTTPIQDPAGGKDRFGNPRLLGHKIEIVGAEAATVRTVFRMAAAGASPQTIAAKLTALGARKPRGTGAWAPSSVRGILGNARYSGTWSFGKVSFVKVNGVTYKRRNAPDDVATTEIPALALVTAATVAKAHAAMASRSVEVPRGTGGRLAGWHAGVGRDGTVNDWRGLIWCGHCGGPVTIIGRQVAGGKTYRYLGCQRAKTNGPSVCPSKGFLNYEAADEALKDAISTKYNDCHYLARMMARWNNACRQARLQTGERAAAQAAVAQAEQELANIATAIKRGVVGETTARLLQEAEAAKAAAVDRLARLDALAEAEPVVLPPHAVGKAIRAEALAERRAALRAVVAKVILTGTLKGRRGSVWTGEIIPRPEAGITWKLPISLGKGGYYPTGGMRGDSASE